MEKTMADALQSRLKKLLADRGKKPAPFAKEVGLGADLIRDIVRKGSMPSADRLALIADGLGVSTDYLLGRTDDPTATKQGPITSEPEILSFLARIKGFTKTDIDAAFGVIMLAMRSKPGGSQPDGDHDQSAPSNHHHAKVP